MGLLKKVTDERDALLAENRRLRREAELHLADPDQKSLSRLKRALEIPAPSHLFVARKEPTFAKK